MTPVEPPLHLDAQRRVFAKDQQPYFPLPASVDRTGTVMTEWELSAEDRAIIMRGGRIRLWLLHTGVNLGVPLTPVAVEAVEPVAVPPVEDKRSVQCGMHRFDPSDDNICRGCGGHGITSHWGHLPALK